MKKILLLFWVVLVITTNAQTLQVIKVTPSHILVPRLGQLQLKATGIYSNGTTQDLTNLVTWTVNGGSVNGTISNTSGSNGLYTAPASGSAHQGAFITATSGSIFNEGVIAVGYDSDGDGVPDQTDNCKMAGNATQADLDGDGIGDVCDCTPTVANPSQPSAPAIIVTTFSATSSINSYSPTARAYAKSPVTFSAYYGNAGSNPSLQWKINNIAVPGATNREFSVNNLVNGDIITCTLTPGVSCGMITSVTSLPVACIIDNPVPGLPSPTFALPASSFATFFDGGGTIYSGNHGQIICDFTPSALPSSFRGDLIANVYLESTVITHSSQKYVQRHYDLFPFYNVGSTATPYYTGRVILYFTDAEFQAYNTAVGSSFLKLPTVAGGGSADPNRANLRVRQFHGTAPSPFFPGNYSGSFANIDPLDASIKYNGAANRWSIAFDITGFSGFFIYTDATTLPVSLMNFSAQKTTNGTVLNWKTASESYNKGFDIEKSIDGTTFTKIGFVNGSNTSQDVQHYQYTDNTACTGRQLYRLKQIDNDNNFKYSSIATVSCGQVKNVTISPNPAASTITIVADNWVAAKLVNTNGQTVNTIRPAVSNTQQADVSKLPNGLYVLQLIYKDGSMATEKIQVIH